MKKLSKEEMNNISAGAISPFGWGLIGAAISFISGLFDGYTRPYKCR